jgi:hypothetical protein
MRLVVVALLFGNGCSFVNAYDDPGLVGAWETNNLRVSPDGSEAVDVLSADAEGTGTASLHFSLEPDPALQEVRFKLGWEQEDERKFQLAMDCTYSSLGTADCDTNEDFTFRCETSVDENAMICSGDQTWTGLTFDDWVRSE